MIEDELADPSVWSDPKRAPDATKRHEAAKARVASAYAAWKPPAADRPLAAPHRAGRA